MIDHIDPTIHFKKKLVHDILPCDDWLRFMKTVDLIPASPEVEEKEHADSHARLNRTGPINESMRLISGLAGEVVGRCILENQGITAAEDEMLEPYRKVAQTSTQAVVANLIELGLLHVGGHA